MPYETIEKDGIESRINVFGSLLLKSHTGKQNTDDEDIDFELEGIASTEDSDTQGETVIQDGIDWNYAKKYGQLKYEHSKDPNDFLGPITEINPEGSRTRFKARIFAKKGTPQYPRAKSVMGYIRNIQEWNKKYPEKPKKIGFSIEGIKWVHPANPSLVKRSLAKHIVITAEPVNDEAYMTFAKSLSAEYNNFSGGDSTLQTGFSALRKEDLDENKQPRKKKMKHKSYDHAYRFAKNEEGKSQEDAIKYADAWKAQRDAEDAAQESAMNKSLSSIQEAATASATAIGALVSKSKTVIEKTVIEGQTMEKSLQPSSDPEANKNSLARAFKANGEIALSAIELQNLQINALSEVYGKQTDMLKSLGEIVSVLVDRTNRLQIENETLSKAIATNTHSNIKTQTMILAKSMGKSPEEIAAQYGATVANQEGNAKKEDKSLVMSELKKILEQNSGVSTLDIASFGLNGRVETPKAKEILKSHNWALS